MTDTKDYTKTRDTADRLITKFGSPLVVRHLVNSGSALEPTQTAVDTVASGARLAFTQRHRAMWDVKATDQRWLVTAGGEVQIGDKIVVGGAVVGTVAQVEPLSPAAVVVLYDVQVRV